MPAVAFVQCGELNLSLKKMRGTFCNWLLFRFFTLAFLANTCEHQHACMRACIPVFDEIHSFFGVFGFVSLSNAGVPVFGAGAGKAGLMQSTGVLTQRFVKSFHVSPQITRSVFCRIWTIRTINITYRI